jgi:3-hydroxyisobutyrate dehydrogenase
MRVAVIGTGIMGAGMAGALAGAGHDVAVWNRTSEKAAALEGERITAAATVREAVTGADVVITILFDTDSVLAVADEIRDALGPEAVWVQASTLGPDGVQKVAEVAGPRLLDAPVLGTKKPAEDGALTVLVSGPEPLVSAAAPVFDAIGARTVVAGTEVGQASGLKLACNAWFGLLTVGTAQSLALAEALGVDPALFLEALKGGAADTPYLQTKGAAMLAGSYPTSFAVDGVRKDVQLMIDAAGASGTDFPVDLLTAVRAQFDRASEAGHGGDDMAAVRTSFPGA